MRPIFYHARNRTTTTKLLYELHRQRLKHDGPIHIRCTPDNSDNTRKKSEMYHLTHEYTLTEYIGSSVHKL